MTLVLPAFQLVPQHQEQQPQQQPKQQELSAASSVLLIPDSQRLEVPRNKQQLLKAMAEGRVQPFDCGVFAPKKQVRVRHFVCGGQGAQSRPLLAIGFRY